MFPYVFGVVEVSAWACIVIGDVGGDDDARNGSQQPGLIRAANS